MSSINYDALSQGDAGAVQQYDQAGQGRAPKSTNNARFKVGGVFGGFFVTGIVAFILCWIVFSISTTFFMAAFAAFIVIMVFLGYRQTRKGAAMLDQFCRDNGWARSKAVPPEMFNELSEGSDLKKITSQISGDLNGVPFWLADYDREDSKDTVIILELERPLPRALFLVSMPIFGPLKLLYKHLLEKENLHPISLEGDFDSYFQLYIPKGDQVEVLSVVTPDVMMSIIEKGFVSSIYLKGRYCVISSAGGFTYLTGRSLFESASILAKELK